MKRRLLSAILSLIMLLSLVPMTVFAETTTYVKANSVEDGAEYLIVGKGSSNSYAMKLSTTDYPGRETVSISDTSIASASDDCVWTASVSDGKATFSQGSKYLYRSSSSGSVKQGTASEAARWSYDGSHLTTQGSSSTYYMKYSSSATDGKYFTVSTSESTITLYKKTTSGSGEDVQPETPAGNEVYSLTNTLEMGKTYLIVSVNNGAGVALTNNSSSSFATTAVTVADGKIAASSALAKAEWEAKAASSSELIGLYNGSNVLKVDASSTSNPFIKTSGTSYNAGGFGYTTSGHISYPYGNPAQDYFIGVDNGTFVASGSESGLGKVYIFVKGEAGEGGEPATYTVTFNMNGHGENTTRTVTEGSNVAEPTAPTAEGYTFGGWYADEACTNEFNFNTVITENTTVYAKWTEKPVITPDKTVPIEAVKTGTSAKDATIAVGEILAINLTHNSSADKDFTVTVNNAAVASVTPNALTVAVDATGTIYVEGLTDGTATITMSGVNSSSYGGSAGSTYVATINLTVGNGGGTEGGETPAGNEVYTLTNMFEMGKTYLIVSVNEGAGVALANNNSSSFATTAVTVADGKIAASSALEKAEWEAKAASSSELIGLYNGGNVLKVDASSSSNPYIKTSGTSYSAGGFGYTTGSHISYPYSNTPYYIGVNNNTFAASSSESGLGKVYIFVKGTAGEGGDVEHTHSFGEWTVDTPATCTEKGLEKHTCSCGEFETREIAALGHDIVHHDAKAATCDAIGWAAYETCSRCDYTTYSEIAAKGHNYGEWTSSETQHQRVCANDASHKETANHKFVGNTCTVCGYTKAVVPTETTYVAFTSDVHNSSGNTSATRLNDWIDTVSGKLNAKFADMGMCGDMANASSSESSYWSLAKTTMDTVKNSENVVGNGFFVCGNHEWSPGNFGSTSSDQKSRIQVVGSYDAESAYVLYSLGATSSSDSGTGIKSEDITALQTYLQTAPTDRPIFVLSHFPLHSSSGSFYGGRSTKNASTVIDVLNTAANNGHTIIFLWGHNHTLSDSNYDKVITDKIGSAEISFTYAAAGCMSDSDYGSGSGSVKGKGLVAAINGTNVVLSYYDVNGSVVASGTATVGGNGGQNPPVVDPDVPTGTVEYKLVNGFELGKTYLIVSANDGQGKVLTSDLTTSNVTVANNKIAVSAALSASEWKVDNSVNGRLGLYNGSKVLKINASDANNPQITTEDEYNYGGFTYTDNHHFAYPYGGGSGTETTYYFGVKNGEFVASNTESGLGEVYLFEKVEGTQGGDDPVTPPTPSGDVIEVTPTSSNSPVENKTIAVGDTFTVRVTNGSTSSAYDFTVSFSKNGVATADTTSVNIAAGATKDIVITGAAAGSVTITIANNSSYSQYTRKATINLTVTGEGGEEPIDPPAPSGDVIEVTPTTDNPTQSKTIAVGDTFTLSVTNGSSSNAYDFTVSFSKNGVATADTTSVNIAAGATKDIVITGAAAGSVTITIANNSSYSQYTRKATINLTVTGEGGEEPIDPPVSGDVIELTPSRENSPSTSKTIAVGESFTVALTNSSTNSAYDFATTFSKSGIASASPASVNVAMGGTENIVITGQKAGTVTITFSNENSYDSSYNRVATINLTVTGEGGEEPIDPPTPTGDAVYVAFSSDVHNGSGSVSSADRLNGWINKVTSINGARLDNMGFCGDMGPASGSADSFWNNAQTVMNTVKNNTNVVGDGFYVCGNHEYNPGNYSHNLNDTTRNYSDAGTALETSDYIFYSMGARQWDETYSDADINAMSEFLSAHSDFDGPIFILSHFPLHSYSSGGGWGWGGSTSTSGESSGIHDGRPAVGSAKIINVLNEYPNVIYLWGHNHSSSNDHYDAVYTDKINDTEINFTYAAAGCMSDSEYGSSGNVKGKGLVAAIYDDSVVLTYYDANGNEVGSGATIPMNGSSAPATEYTITASAGENGSISPNGAVAVKEGRSKTFTFAPNAGYEVDTVLVNGKAVSVSGNSYTMANVTDNATISVSFKKIQGTTYTLATEMKAGQYILVSNGYALFNNNGTISAVPVTVSGNTVTISDSNVDGATWTFTAATGSDKSGDYVVKSGDYYFSRVSDASGSSVAAEITTEQKTSEASGLPYYQWTYDVANGQLSHIGGQDQSATFYAYYDTSANAFYTASSEQSLQLYVVDASQPEHTHSFGEWTVVTEATCTEKGQEQRTCSGCDAVETRDTDALGHDYKAVVTAPTCTEQGYTTYTCANCSDSYKDAYTDALGHDYKPVVTEPTCTAAGYTTYTCANCSHSYKDAYTDALGHAYGDWTSISETQHQCVCANDANHVVVANHNFSGDTCVDCGYTKPVVNSLSGKVVSYNNEDDVITIELLKDGEVVYTTTVTGNDTTYAFDAVAAGTYTLKASKSGHVDSQYTVTVNGSVTQDIKIYLLGDVDGNGKVNMVDVTKIRQYLTNNAKYPLDVPAAADVDNSGKINMVDVTKIRQYLTNKDKYPLGK